MKFTFTMPIVINHLYKQGKHGWYKDQKAVDWQEVALWRIKTTKKNFDGFKGDTVYVTWIRADKRKWDIDSGLKLLLDTLVKGGILEDDNDITEMHIFKRKGESNYCEVEIL